MSSLDERAFSTASSTFCPEILRLFQSWALTRGIDAETPTLYVFQRPTSIPPPLGMLGIDEEPASEPSEPVEPSVPVEPLPVPSPLDEPPINLLMSISIYITCFLIVLINEPVMSICGKREAYVPFFAYPMRSISLSATLTDAFSLNAIFSASSNVMTVLVWELSASCATAFRDIITEAATSRNLGKIFFIILTLNCIYFCHL